MSYMLYIVYYMYYDIKYIYIYDMILDVMYYKRGRLGTMRGCWGPFGATGAPRLMIAHLADGYFTKKALRTRKGGSICFRFQASRIC